MLAERGVEVEAVLDEGTGLVGQGVYPFIHKPVALVSTAEKGYMSMKISTTALGGTSASSLGKTPDCAFSYSTRSDTDASSRAITRSYSIHCARVVEISS
jgi:hypothetical protein